jgi:hypothetical protein
LAGLVLGGLASILGMSGQDWGLGTAVLVTGGVWAAAFFGPLALAATGGRAARQVYNPSGSSTPPKREYSHAESLAARGMYQEAIDAFEMAVLEDPSDPTPYLRIARINRDQTGGFQDAAKWFKRSLNDAELPSGLSYLIIREIVELYVTKLKDPNRAAPLLARVAEEQAGTREGEWAAEELARIKTDMTERMDD